METHKLATGPLVISVASAEVVEGGFGMQVKLSGIDCSNGGDVCVYITESTAVRQLERLGLNLQTVPENALHIEQVKKDGRTYTNFRMASQSEIMGTVPAASAPAPAPAAAPQAAVAPPVRQATPPVGFNDSVRSTYRECLLEALEMADNIAERGYNVDGGNVIAIAATLFIQSTKR
jgi:hypothetical protein